MKILFVGGPMDGKRQLWPDKHTWVNVPVFASNFKDPPANLAEHVGICIHTYRLQRFTIGNGEYLEAAFHTSVNNPMAALIKGYRYYRRKR